MTLTLAARLFEVLLGFSLLLQTVEFLKIRNIDWVSDWQIQRTEVPVRPKAWLWILDRLFQPQAYTGLLWVRGALAVWLMTGGLPAWGALMLFAVGVAMLFRWRGAFNGGSDFMTLVGLTGLLLAHGVGAWTDVSHGWRVGLWYVTLQSLTSYFVSGWVKLMRPEWRSGQALPAFLDTGIYGPLPQDSVFRHPQVARLIAWSFTVWEGCFPLALLDVRLAAVFCVVAAGFHFLVFYFFGLNRFFWAWLVTFPAVMYAAS